VLARPCDVSGLACGKYAGSSVPRPAVPNDRSGVSVPVGIWTLTVPPVVGSYVGWTFGAGPPRASVSRPKTVSGFAQFAGSHRSVTVKEFPACGSARAKNTRGSVTRLRLILPATL